MFMSLYTVGIFKRTDGISAFVLAVTSASSKPGPTSPNHFQPPPPPSHETPPYIPVFMRFCSLAENKIRT